jgi:hypothetical protein
MAISSFRSESIIELLQYEGIKNERDFANWCAERRQKGESRFSTLKRIFGEVNAHRIMRVVEVASWKLVDVRKKRAAIKRTARTIAATRRDLKGIRRQLIPADERLDLNLVDYYYTREMGGA